MSGSFGVRVSGPLEEFAEGFAAELSGLGYSPRGGEAQLRLMAHLSRWMLERRPVLRATQADHQRLI